MITLCVHHNIFVKINEMKKLQENQTIKTIGVSVPVWFYQGNTSEPAKEVFCRYVLSNIKDNFPVMPIVNGYKINILQLKDFNITKQLIEENKIFFSTYNKIRKSNEKLNIIHNIDIKNYDVLLNSLN